MSDKLLWRTAMSIFAAFMTAVLIRECREIKQTHDAVIRLEAKSK